MHIEMKAISRRAPVISDQANLFAKLTRNLIAAYGRHPRMGLDDLYELSEYDTFCLGAYACGFVCRDFALMNGQTFEKMKGEPRLHLSDCSFRTLRHWIHMLLRAERWNHPYASVVGEAIETGALALVAERLENDQSLREPEAVMVDNDET